MKLNLSWLMKHYGPMERPWALFDVNNMLWKMVSWLTLKRIMTPAFLTCYWQKSAQRVFLSGSFCQLQVKSYRRKTSWYLSVHRVCLSVNSKLEVDRKFLKWTERPKDRFKSGIKDKRQDLNGSFCPVPFKSVLSKWFHEKIRFNQFIE